MTQVKSMMIFLRRAVGILALAFPILLLIFGGIPMQTSISATYWTNAGVLFTSMLFTMGLVLISYKGYDKADDWISGIAGGAMMVVAFFPCEVGIHPVTAAYLIPWIGERVNHIIHYVAAAVTFGLMGWMSFFQFTISVKRGDVPSGEQKAKRNIVYAICGLIIFVVLGVGVILEIVPGARTVTDHIRLWYWLESVMVWAFGVSWLVKGETLFKD